MTVELDEVASASSTRVQRAAALGVDVDEMLNGLYRARRNRRVGVLVCVALVLGVVGVVGASVVSGGRGTHHSARPGRPSDHPSTTPRVCSVAMIRCLGGRRFGVNLRAPITVTLPSNFSEELATLGGNTVLETYRAGRSTTGVTVLEGAIPTRYDASWSRDRSAGTTAAHVAQWLAHRPFLTQTSIERVSVGGRPAWRVSARLRPGAALPAFKGGQGRVAPTFTAGAATAAYGRDLAGTYTLLDLPSVGLTVIWSWTEARDLGALVGNQAYIDGLRFE